jgi:NADPH-dependent 2,4-dienoyl-CoA reductase/sulfur reductase-like enzyme
MLANMSERLLVIGADAAGMSAAHQALRTARRNGRDLEVVAVDAGDHTSYSACGIPYWIAGDVDSPRSLVARTAAEHRAAGVDLRLGIQAVGLDLDGRTCELRDVATGRRERLGFDQVMLATGAAPVLPDWAVGHPRVHPVKTLDDGARWTRLLADRPASALVVGGGYIGVEVAESFARRGVRTTLVTRGDQLMAATLEPGTAEAARRGLEAAGVEVVTGSEVGGIETAADGSLHAVCVSGRHYAADVVAIGLGVAPRVGLARDAGLPVGGAEVHGALLPDGRQRLADGVWAAGDCTAVADLLLGGAAFVPLGTHANKCGRVAGTNIAGGSASFPGVVGTAITRAGAVEIARTGLLPTAADRLGFDVLTRRLDSTTASGYMPQAAPMSVWVMAEAATGRLLGCQLSGGAGAGKRIDVAATALTAGMTVRQVAYLDLAYAPPFSPTWDPVQIACRGLGELLDG